MAKRPNELAARSDRRARKAETLIDAVISGATESRVTIDVRLLDLSYAEWNALLAPKYKAAGWRVAMWVSDQRDGDFIDLQA